MKKLLLFSSFLLLSYTASQAQVIVYCEAPAAIAGNKTPFSWADPSGGTWATPDLNVPANAIKDTLKLVDDGTAADSLGCTNPLANDLTGKIAVVYRGACEFGVKAKNAQDKGAVGVIIINNVPDAPIGISGGAQGMNVTIPVVLITKADGAALRGQMDLGNPVVVFIGNKFGLYPNDLGLYAIDLLVPRVTANPALISANATEFNVPMGGWVHNYGSASQSNVTLNVSITGAATYTAASTPVTIAPGDSVYATIPTYSAATYSGLYHVRYSVNYGNTDDFKSDNTFYANFLIDSLLSYALIDSATQMPKSSAHYKLATPPAEYKTCIHFMDPNASRLSALGLYTSATTTVTLSLAGEGIDAVAYEWNDSFTGFSDTVNFPSGLWNLNPVGLGSYTYGSDLQGKMIYIPFSAPVHLVDNQRYLFCNRTYSPDVNLGFDAHFNYIEAIANPTDGHDQPVSCVITDTDNYATGFGTDVSASVSVLFGDKFASVNENNKSFNVTPYPNPTTDFIKVPLKGISGSAQLKIMDVEGKILSTQTVKVAGDVTVNVKGIAAGNYVFNMTFEDGRSTTFKVAITK